MKSLVAIALFACGAPAMFGATTAAKSVAVKPAKAPATDTAIESNIRARFAKSKISIDHFQVHVQGGVATLEGKTDIIQHKGTATRLARASSAIRVDNKIQISEAARQKAASNLAKGRQSATLKRGEIVKK